MKKILLLMLLLPDMARAQKFEFNIGAGLSTNTDKKGMVSPMAQIGLTYITKKASVGIEVNGMHIANNYRIFSAFPGIIFFDKELVYRGYSPQLFVKGRSALGKITFEYGVQGGFFHFINYRANFIVSQPSGSYEIIRKTKVESNFGPIGGLVVSAKYPISPSVGLYLKFTPQYYRIDSKSKGVYLPLSAGLSVKLNQQ